jgi:hypothetical protein
MSCKMGRTIRWSLLFAFCLCLAATSNAARNRIQEQDNRYYSQLHNIQEEDTESAVPQQASSKWEWIIKSLRPSAAILADKKETYRFLDSLDEIYRSVFAGEKTRIAKRSPTMAAEVESLLREVGAFDDESESVPTVPNKRNARDAEQTSAGGLCGGVGRLSNEYGPMVRQFEIGDLSLI